MPPPRSSFCPGISIRCWAEKFRPAAPLIRRMIVRVVWDFWPGARSAAGASGHARHGPAALAALSYPGASNGRPAPRTAILSPGYRPSRRLRVFDGWSPAAAAFQPQAIAAPPATLEVLARRKLDGRLNLPSLTHALIALTPLGDPLVPDSLRDLFWRAFQVPLFEQLRGPRLESLAWECDAHAGLHLRHGHYVQNGTLLLECGGEWLPAGHGTEIMEHRCPCGHATPRLAASATRMSQPDVMILT